MNEFNWMQSDRSRKAICTTGFSIRFIEKRNAVDKTILCFLWTKFVSWLILRLGVNMYFCRTPNTHIIYLSLSPAYSLALFKCSFLCLVLFNRLSTMPIYLSIFSFRCLPLAVYLSVSLSLFIPSSILLFYNRKFPHHHLHPPPLSTALPHLSMG